MCAERGAVASVVPGRPQRLLLMLFLLALVPGCERRAEVAPEELLTLRTLGLAHLEDNRLQASVGVFREMIQGAPREALGHANLGLALLRLDRAAEAIEPLERAVELRSDEPAIRFNLAAAYAALGRGDQARTTLEGTLRSQPGHVRTLYELARLASSPEHDEPARRAEYLDRLLEADPANLVVRLELAEAWLAMGDADRAAARLEEIRGLVPEISDEAVAPLEASLVQLDAGDDAAGLASLRQLRNLLLVTPSFQESFQRLYGPVAGVAGIPVERFGPDFLASPAVATAILAAVSFSDATASAGLGDLLPAVPSTDDPAVFTPFVTAADVQRDGLLDLLLIDSGGARLLLGGESGFTDGSPDELQQMTGPRTAAFGDFDDDGFLDLYVAGDGSNLLLRSDGAGGWRDATSTAAVGDAGAGRHALFADLDHEGDLDLLLLNGDGVRWYRNNGDGTFLESGEVAGLPAGEGARDVVFGDFDGDVDLDLVFAGAGGTNRFYSNLREGRFGDATESSGLGEATAARTVGTGDYDNDGDLDLFFAGDAGYAALYRNAGDASFVADERSTAVLGSLGRLDATDGRFLDFDNDGFLDLLVAGYPPVTDAPVGTSPDRDSAPRRGTEPGLRLFRNDGTGVFETATSLLPENLPAVGGVTAVDRDDDGDLDMVVATAADGVRFLDNEGGDAHHHLKVTLVGLTGGSGKVNRAGIGSTVEVRAGPLYQMRVVTEPITHFGLGDRSSVDAVRVVWTNGVPQSAIRPPVDAMLVEEQVLKGSCAFVYAWDGEGFRFVTDAVWKSALGMPVGIMALSETPGAEGDDGMSAGRAARIYAGPLASKEYVRIPGEALRPDDGRLRLRITEELWEVAYIDEVKLVAVDHPDSLDVYVDEKFVPPAPPVLRLYGVSRRHPPVTAVDEQGTDVLQAVLYRDDDYVSNLVPGRFQGITRAHDLILDLGQTAAAADSVVLFLTGWVFPTDASINVAMSQATALSSQPPRLEIPDGRGGWETVVSNLGFPAGKAKTVIVDLSGLLPADDPRVRIRTNMQIYWDHIFFSTGPTGAAPVAASAGELEARIAAPLGPHGGRLGVLNPSGAQLRYRGFSREYRKGGRHGPHWFDYDDVSTSPRWVPITGRYTRYGDVLPLLAEADDRYVILAPGDEIALDFAVPDRSKTAAEPPPEWRRTYLLYTVGWIKDADMNTATGNTVEPLPFHDMRRYPYGPEEVFPADSVGRVWDGAYNTRTIRRAPPPVGQEPGVGG